jgi:glycosyltransferase involved in cell wall biosynthesis
MTYGLVISSYKYGHLAAHCIESILCQTTKYDKIWFVDDGVGDCKHLPKLYPNINFVLREHNLGVVENFDDMLNKVDTDYVMFLGADNWLRADALESLKEMSIENDIVTYDIIVTGELRNQIWESYSFACQDYQGDYYWSREKKHHGSMLYRTQLAKIVGGYAHDLKIGKMAEDQNLWDKMIKEGARVSHVPKGLLYYRRHKENFFKYE